MSAIPKNHHIERIIGMLGGALAGAALGAQAGLGALAFGIVIGAWVGHILGIILEQEHLRTFAAERKLDDTIGVTGGPLGAGRPDDAPISSTDEPTPHELRSRV